MAVLTHIGGVEVARLFSGGDDVVVAVLAAGGDAGVVEPGRRPRAAAVAIVALGAGLEMFGAFSRGRDAIMAGLTGSQHLAVIDPQGRRPRGGAVTVFALVGRGGVGGGFAGGDDVVVAVLAVVVVRGVLEPGRDPGVAGMTVVALGGALDMVGESTFSNYAVVAGRAGPPYLPVIHPHGGHPGRGQMAILAQGRCIDMAGVPAGCLEGVVAVLAVAGDAGVIVPGGEPGIAAMAIVAPCFGRDMAVVFCRGGGAVVAGHTGSEYMIVIQPQRRHPGCGVVAFLADVGGTRVRCGLEFRPLESALAMAVLALSRGSSEQAARVAGVAGRFHMGAHQLETGAQMIE